jgi:hypothetical protein
MTTTKQIIILGAAIVLSSSFMWIPRFQPVNINTPNTTKKDVCVDLIDSLTEIIVDQKDQIHFLRDELQYKESEISYWGHKYDSIKIIK